MNEYMNKCFDRYVYMHAQEIQQLQTESLYSWNIDNANKKKKFDRLLMFCIQGFFILILNFLATCAALG